MTAELSLKQIQKAWHGTLKAYVTGFILSALLTAVSFYLVAEKILEVRALMYTIAGLALVQAVVQLVFFLHLGQEATPRWESVVFYFMVVVLTIIAAGSLWVMNDLNERMMPSMEERTKGTFHD